MVRRAALIALAGMLAGVVTISVGSVSAQDMTKSVIKERLKEGAAKVQAKWQSLPPEQQQKLMAQWKVTAEEAVKKWESLTPAQQQELKQKTAAAVKKVQKKWQQLPP